MLVLIILTLGTLSLVATVAAYQAGLEILHGRRQQTILGIILTSAIFGVLLNVLAHNKLLLLINIAIAVWFAFKYVKLSEPNWRFAEAYPDEEFPKAIKVEASED